MKFNGAIFLYSTTPCYKNRRFTRQVCKFINDKAQQSKSQIKICYIAAHYNSAHDEFTKIKKEFSNFLDCTFSLFICDFPSDTNYLEKIICSNIFLLGGGNTFEFAKNLNEFKFSDILFKNKELICLAAVSAGAIYISPNLGLAGYPEYDKDENQVMLKNLSGLNLFNFEFFPHYNDEDNYSKSLCEYSINNHARILAFDDNVGCIYYNNKIQIFGYAFYFKKGTKSKLPKDTILLT